MHGLDSLAAPDPEGARARPPHVGGVYTKCSKTFRNGAWAPLVFPAGRIMAGQHGYCVREALELRRLPSDR